MKKMLVFVVACVMLFTCIAPTIVLAADADWWGIDGVTVAVQPQTDWEPVGDGVSDGMSYFPDYGLLIYWLFGKHAFGW